MKLETTIRIVGASLGIALFIVEVIDVPKYVKRILKKDITARVRPLDCITCLTFWASVILTAIFYTDLLTAISAPFTSLVLGYLLDKKIYS